MKRGYTLLETVVYIGILAVIVVLALGAILSIYQAYGKARIERQIATNGDVAMERIIREVRAATSTKASSVFGSHPGVLALSTDETFSLSGGLLRVQEGALPAQNLTSSDVTISNLIFYASTSPNSTIIRAEMTLDAGAGVFARSKKFYGSAVLRRAY